MAEATDAAIAAREAQQRAALAGRHKDRAVQLEIGICDHEWEYNYDERTCIHCLVVEVAEP